MLAIGFDEIDVFDLHSKKRLLHGTNVGGYIDAIVWLNDHLLITGSSDEDGAPGAYIIWDVRNGNGRTVLGAVPAGAGSMISNGDCVIVSGSYEDGGNSYVATIDIVRARVSGIKTAHDPLLFSGPVRSGKLIATTPEGVAELKWPSLRRLRVMKLSHSSGDIAVVGNGTRIYALVKNLETENGNVVQIRRRLWKIGSRIPVKVHWPQFLVGSPNGRNLVIGGSRLGIGSDVAICELLSIDQKSRWRTHIVKVLGDAVSALAWSPTGLFFATAVEHGDVIVYHAP